MSTTVEVTDRASKPIAEFNLALTSGKALSAIGQAAVVLVQENFNALPPNKQFPTSGFWKDAVRSTSYAVGVDRVTVSVAKLGVRQRLLGGWLRPKNGKYLTIPEAAEAYGRRAGEFGNLRFGFAENRFGNLAPALVEASASGVSFGRKKKDGSRTVKQGAGVGGKVFYFLVRQAFQQANPEVLPSRDRLIEAGRAAAENHAKRQAARVGGTS